MNRPQGDAMSLHALVEKWRGDAKQHREQFALLGGEQYNAPGGIIDMAITCEEHADELEAALAGGGEAVRTALASYQLQFTKHDEDGPLSLFDVLTPPGDVDIGRGKQELELLADHVASAIAATHPADAVQIPEGYVLLPRRLTAENGAKGLLSGEFAEGFEMNCGECDSVDEDTAQHCDVCNGHGTYRVDTPIGWNTIKDIYRMIVDNLALNPGGSRE